MNDRKVALIISFLLFVLFGVIAVLSEKVYEGGDNYTHFQIARGVFDYPHLLLDHWGKPFYTLLIAPFTLLGFTATKLFITFLGVLAAYITFLVCEKLEMNNRILVFAFVCFVPIYFLLLNSTFTEVMFACALIASIYLILSERYIAACILLSFIPFIRTEGYFLLPFFAWYLFTQKKTVLILLFGTGTILYSVIGYFHYNDLFWIVTKMPYTGAADIYGHGGPFDYIFNYKDILGTIASFLFVLGIFSYVLHSVLNIRNVVKDPIIVLILAPMMFFLAFHSYLWWKGLGGSLGSIRIMVSVIPLAAIFCLIGYNRITDALVSDKVLKPLASVVLPALVIFNPFVSFGLPFRFNDLEKSILQAADIIKSVNKEGSKVFYYDPLLVHFLDESPYDTSKVQQYIPDLDVPSNGIKEGTFIVWDAHFSPNEGRLPLQNLLADSNMTLLKKIRPNETYIMLGGYEFEVYVFRKCGNKCKPAVQKLADFDFDKNIPSGYSVDSTRYLSAPHSLALTAEKQYSPGVEMPVKDLDPAITNLVNISADILSDSWNDSRVTLVLSFEKDGKSENYYTLDVKSDTLKPGIWQSFKFNCSIPLNLKEDATFKAYVWNHGTNTILVDNLKVWSEKLSSGN